MTPEEESVAQEMVMEYLKEQPPVQLEVDVQTALLVIGNLQLALRHPDNMGAGSQAIRRFVSDLQERIAPVGSPIYAIIEEGWNTS